MASSIQLHRPVSPGQRLRRRSAAATTVMLLLLLVRPSWGAEPAVEFEDPDPDAVARALEADQYRNSIEFSLGGTMVKGDQAAFESRSGLPTGLYGGIESYHFEQEAGESGLFSMDGRAILDNNDYRIELKYDVPDIGYVRGGYKEFRTYYDGSGGYFPGNDQWFHIYDDGLALDRRTFWVETGLRKPGVPFITLRFERNIRDGRKGSLVWGDSNLTGGAGTRGISPSFWDLDEERNIVSVDGSHPVGNTDIGLGVRYEFFDNDNSRNIRRTPTEQSDRHLTHSDGIDGDMFSAHGSTITRLNDELRFTTGYIFTTMDTDLSGSRIYGSSYDPMYDPVFARRQFRDEGFLDLEGGSKLNQHVANLNLMWTPAPTITLVPSVRIERQDIDSVSHFTETTVGAAPGLVTGQEELRSTSDKGLTEVTEALELRYSGVTNWVFYMRGLWMQGQGDLEEIENVAGTVDLLRDTDFDRFMQKYSAGFNYYPLRNLNFAAQYYYKVRNEDYDHTEDTTPNRSGNSYPAFLVAQDFTTHDVNGRVTWRALPSLTFVSRYDYQLSCVEMKGDGLRTQESADITSHIFSESVTWSPWHRIYLQANVNYALDETDTPADKALGNDTVLDTENDYWNAGAGVGFFLNEKTDLQTQYHYYRADNYEDNSALSQPYGIDAEEHGVSATLTRRITDRIRWRLLYGFFKGTSETAGGHNDYQAHLVKSSLEMFF